jgi:hypothetical protein
VWVTILCKVARPQNIFSLEFIGAGHSGLSLGKTRLGMLPPG